MAILSDDEKKKAKQIEEQTKKNTEVPSIKRNANQFTGYSQSALNSLAKGSYGKEHETEKKARNYVNAQNKKKLDASYNKVSESKWEKIGVSELDENRISAAKQNFGAHANSAIRNSEQAKEWEQKYGVGIDDLISAYDEHAKNVEYDWAKKHPVLAEIKSTIPNIISGITGIEQTLAEAIAPESSFAEQAKEANDIANTAKNRLRNAVDEVKGEPSKVKSFVRQTADTVLPTLSTGLVTGPAGAAVMAGGLAANRKLQDLEDRGIEGRSRGLQALTYGGLEGGANALTAGAFDKLPLNSVIGQSIKNAGSAALENAAGETIEQIIDKYAGGDNSEYETNKAIAMMQGMAEDEADAYAKNQMLSQIGTTAAMGAITGGLGTLIKQGAKKLPSLFSNTSDAELPKTDADTTSSVDMPKVEEPKTDDVIADLNNKKAELTEIVRNSEPNSVEQLSAFDGIAKIDEAIDSANQINNKAIEVSDVGASAPITKMQSAQTETPILNAENSTNAPDNTIPRLAQQNANSQGNTPSGVDASGMGDGTRSVDNSGLLSDKIRESKSIVNTGERSGLVTQEEIDTDQKIKEIKDYAVRTQDAVTQRAISDIESGSAELEQGLIDGSIRVDNDLAVVESRLIAMDLDKRANEAKANGDMDTYLDLEARRKAIIEHRTKGGTEMARGVNAFKIFEHTADAAEENAVRMTNKEVEKWTKRNSADAQKTNKLAGKILESIENKKKEKQNSQFNRAMYNLFPAEEVEAKTKPTYDEVRESIESSLMNGEFASMYDNFAPDELDYIARRIQLGISQDDLNNIIATKMATGKLGITDDTLSKVRELYDKAGQYGLESKARFDLEDAANKLIANDIYGDRGFFEQYEGWRFLSMLGNFRTHARNIIGNVQHFLTSEVKDNIAAAVEDKVNSVASIGQNNGLNERYRTSLDGNDKSLLKASELDADEIYTRLNGTGRYNDIKAGIEKSRKAFNDKTLFGKFMNKVNDLNSNALDKEDYFFLKKKYKQSLARFLKANDADESIFNSKNQADIDLLEKGRDFAVLEAQKATFHEYSELANGLTSLSQKWRSSDNIAAKGAGYAIEGLIPFKKTPINILKQGIKYSPASLAKGFIDLIKALKSGGGNVNASKVIDDFASGLTGTGIMALGMFMHRMGYLTGGAEENYDADNAQTLQGDQNYAIKLGGNKSYTLDWLAPSSMPLFIGVEMDKAIQKANNGEDIEPEQYWNIAANVAQPITEMSMLQGISNTLESLAYGNIGDATANLGVSMLTGYATQGVPTLFGQIARSVDDTRRSTYTGKKGAFNTATKGIIKTVNKLPGLSNLNEPYIDAKGNTEENVGGNFFGRLAYNMLSPGYYKSGTKSDTDIELNRLYEITGEQVYPTVSDGKVGDKKLSREKYTDYQQLYGYNTTKLYDAVINMDVYKSLPDEDKAEMLTKARSVSKAIADYRIGGKEPSKENEKAIEAFEKNGIDGVIDYYKTKYNAKALDMDYDDYIRREDEYEGGAEQYAIDHQNALDIGIVKSDGTANMDAYDKLNEAYGGNIDADALNTFDASGIVGYDPMYKYGEAKNVIPSLSANQFAQIYSEMNTDRKTNDDGSYKNDGITQDEFVNYINSHNLTADEVEQLYKIFKGNWKRIPSLKNGSWKMVKQ